MNDPTASEDDGLPTHECPAMARPITVTPEDERQFLVAMQAYKHQSGRLFPTWSEILEVLCSLGYAKRIWKPVTGWSMIPSNLSAGESGVGESSEVLGWYSRVETPSGT